jgi:hypothetical protein
VFANAALGKLAAQPQDVVAACCCYVVAKANWHEPQHHEAQAYLRRHSSLKGHY